jgi:hypothetical protein
MRHNTRALLEHRLDAAGAAVARRREDHAMQVLADALNGAPEPERRAVEQRLRA